MNFLRLTPLLLIFLLCQCSGGESHYLSESKYIPVFSEDSCRYIDRSDELHFAYPFYEATLFYDDLALVCTGKEKKWGYINDEGEAVYPAVYEQATIFHENRAWVVRPNEAPSAIDTKGRLKLTLSQASQVSIFCEGLAAFSQKEKHGECWGFIDKEGNTIVQPQYKEVKFFFNGLAAVKDENGLWGYIDTKGNVKITPQYRSAESFSSKQQAIVQPKGSPNLFQVIDTKGEVLLEIEGEALIADGEIFQLKRAGKWGWCNAQGETIIAPQFEAAHTFGKNDLAPVKLRGKWGYINNRGEWKIKRQFTDAYPFFDGQAAVQAGTLYGLIDLNGHYQINPQYDRIAIDYLKQSLGKGTAFTTVQNDRQK